MAVKIEVKSCRSVTVPRSLQETFAYLSDPKTSLLANFPGLQSFESLEPQVFRWVFKKVTYSGQDFQIRFVTRFAPQAPDRIALSSVDDPGNFGNSRMQGEWRLRSTAPDTTEITFDVKLDTELPIPFFLKAMAAPLAQTELGKLFDRYLGNVAKTLQS